MLGLSSLAPWYELLRPKQSSDYTLNAFTFGLPNLFTGKSEFKTVFAALSFAIITLIYGKLCSADVPYTSKSHVTYRTYILSPILWSLAVP